MGRKHGKSPRKSRRLPIARDPLMESNTANVFRKDNIVNHAEDAKKLADACARILINSVIQTKGGNYRVLREVEAGMFGFTYEVRQRGEHYYFLRTEPLTADKKMMYFKKLKLELVILQKASRAEHSTVAHFPKFQDSGCTDEFKFLISQALGENLYDITRTHMKNTAFSIETALRVGIQMLRGIMNLHNVGYLHRYLRPQTFAIGLGSRIRTIYFFDLGFPFSFRERKTRKVKRPRKSLQLLGSMRYMSRNAHINKDLARRDDLEAWCYISMEFSNLKILPWKDDQVDSVVLAKKQKFIDGDYPLVFMTMTLRYKQLVRYISNMKFHERPDYGYIQQILQEIRIEKGLDFTLPYDWEKIKGLRAMIGREDNAVVADPAPAKSPSKMAEAPRPEPQTPPVKTPKSQKVTPMESPVEDKPIVERTYIPSKDTCSIQPASVHEEENEESEKSDSSNKVRSSTSKHSTPPKSVNSLSKVQVSSASAEKPKKTRKIELPMFDKLIDVDMQGPCSNANEDYCQYSLSFKKTVRSSEKVSEQKVSEQKVSEQKVSEQKISEQKVSEQKVNDQKADSKLSIKRSDSESESRSSEHSLKPAQ